jgi:hypothetical protein
MFRYATQFPPEPTKALEDRLICPASPHFPVQLVPPERGVSPVRVKVSVKELGAALGAVMNETGNALILGKCWNHGSTNYGTNLFEGIKVYS